MEVARGQQLGLACFEPLARGRPLTPGTMPIAATVVGNDRVAASVVLTARNVSTECRCAAALDGTHHLQLAEAHVAAVGVAPSGTVVAEDVRKPPELRSLARAASRKRSPPPAGGMFG